MAAGDVTVSLPKIEARACNFFDGVDDYVECTHVAAHLGANFSAGMTIAAWIQARGLGESNAGIIVSKESLGSADGFRFRLNTSNKIMWAVNSGAVNSDNNAIALDGTWYRILITCSAAGATTIYSNGTSVGTGTTNALSQITDTSALRIGNRAGATDRTFEGSIADVKIWNKVLDATEISQDASDTPVTDSLVSHWPLGGTYTDQGSAGSDGTNSGSSSSNSSEGNIRADLDDARVSANDIYLLTETATGEVGLVHIEEA